MVLYYLSEVVVWYNLPHLLQSKDAVAKIGSTTAEGRCFPYNAPPRKEMINIKWVWVKLQSPWRDVGKQKNITLSGAREKVSPKS